MANLVLILIVVLIAVIAWAIFKKVFKIVFYIGIALLLLIMLNTFFIYKDMLDLRENFADSTKKILLVDEDEVLTGLLLGNNIEFIGDNELEKFSNYYKEKKYESILGDSYKLMVFDVGIITNLDVNEIEVGKSEISRNDAESILKSNNPFEMLQNKGIDGVDLDLTAAETKSNSKVKAALFGSILENHILSANNPLFFLSEFKEGNIAIYPKTALFKTVKFIPLSFMKSAGKKILTKAKESVKEFIED